MLRPILAFALLALMPGGFDVLFVASFASSPSASPP
jgi:hypothetical protein